MKITKKSDKEIYMKKSDKEILFNNEPDESSIIEWLWIFLYVWELELKFKHFFLREPSEIIWRLKKIEELQIKKNDEQFKRRVDRLK